MMRVSVHLRFCVVHAAAGALSGTVGDAVLVAVAEGATVVAPAGAADRPAAGATETGVADAGVGDAGVADGGADAPALGPWAAGSAPQAVRPSPATSVDTETVNRRRERMDPPGSSGQPTRLPPCQAVRSPG
ncbi:hypothetical protein GCM10009665_27060 [Kitasatospora nipponensis]|uniref:Secreted protein n=1 Tax=Kitasatospora nipponensis TaxID=258049 RepID=A0ABN1W712_9ACTN